MTARQLQMAKTMLANPKTIKEICETLNVSKSTLYRYLKPVAEKQTK